MSEEVVASSVVACVSWVRGVWNRARRARIRDMAFSNGFVGSSAVSCVACDRGVCNLLRMARQRAMRLFVGAIVSSVAVCVACAVVTAAEALWIKLRMS